MKQLRTLLHKEWRDQRAQIFVSLALCVLVLILGKALGGKGFDSDVRSPMLTVCLGLFAMLLATETIVRDAHHGVERTLGHVPIPRTLAWIAKAGFVALASAGGYLAMVILELLLRLIERKSMLVFLPVEPAVLIQIAAVAAACFASACVLKRSLPAAFLGLLLVGSVPLVAYTLPPLRLTEWVDVVLCSWTPTGLAAIGVIAFALGSMFAFNARHIDKLGLRRAARCALGASVVLVPVFAGTARKSAWAFDILPFSHTARIFKISPSPDGRFLALWAEQEWDPRREWAPVPIVVKDPGTRVRFEVWILDRQSGAWRQIDDRFRMLPNSSVWDDEGRMIALSTEASFGMGEYSLEHIDPVRAEVVDSRPVELSEALGAWYWRQNRHDQRGVIWKSSRLEFNVPARSFLAPSTAAGIVFHEEDGFLVRYDMMTCATTRLAPLHAPCEHRVLLESPDCRWIVLVEGQGDQRLIDACDGRVLRAFAAESAWGGWSPIPGHVCLVGWNAGENFTVVNEDGSETPLPAFESGWQEFGPDRIVHNDAQHIECTKLDGSEREVLYQARP